MSGAVFSAIAACVALATSVAPQQEPRSWESVSAAIDAVEMDGAVAGEGVRDATSTTAKSRYGQCADYCEGLSGKTYDKQTPAGACDAGCSSAHWTGKSKARKRCEADYGNNQRLYTPCMNGVAHY